MSGSDVFGALLGIVAAVVIGLAIFGGTGALLGGLISAAVVAMVLAIKEGK